MWRWFLSQKILENANWLLKYNVLNTIGDSFEKTYAWRFIGNAPIFNCCLQYTSLGAIYCRSGVTNPLVIACHFVSYRWVIGPIFGPGFSNSGLDTFKSLFSFIPTRMLRHFGTQVDSCVGFCRHRFISLECHTFWT